MSPDMLTLVAAVLAYEAARDMCERGGGGRCRLLWLLLLLAESLLRWSRSRSRKVRSETSVEKDMFGGSGGGGRWRFEGDDGVE